MNKVYFGSWASYDEMKRDFSVDYGKTDVENFPPPETILFASYGGASYEGDAIVWFERDGKLYEVTGGHCSCNGLEGQWEPEEINWDMLKLRVAESDKRIAERKSHYTNEVLTEHELEAVARFRELVSAH